MAEDRKQIKEQIIQLFSEGKTMAETSKIVGVSVSTIAQWRMMDTVFGSDCSRALELGFEIQADSLHTIADDYHDVQKARLKSDNLKWILARRVPHKYGDRLDINLNQTVDITGALLEARNRSTLSLHDPNNIDDAQLVETKSLSDSSASDYKSDAPIETPQKREDDAELPDIFS